MKTTRIESNNEVLSGKYNYNAIEEYFGDDEFFDDENDELAILKEFGMDRDFVY